ncbi:TolC family protein [Paucibacter sp. APW11]|uniref:TolC family protein n=1 Tax=Roseateles aquae TaxID=3077235 RepID=A0ABU3P8C8_9BURK|nr:TolC family protein [Paucibacter sp. APW11]MDT8998832.1 TolC family protein [Paucibacter sp. APW11]
MKLLPSSALKGLLAAGMLTALFSAPVLAQTRCGEEESGSAKVAREAAALELSSEDPRAQLQRLVDMALKRSPALGVSKLLAQAARDDWEETKAARLPQISLNAMTVGIGAKQDGITTTKGLQGRVGVSLSAPLFDFGRQQQLTAWRSQLADAARLGLISTEQQLALQTVSLAMERSRYQLQIQVYQQYVRKMSCIVEALETIVRADRGRSSELVQAHKNQQQAELAVEQTYSALRQAEVRLKRFVGDDLPPSASYAALLTTVPDLAKMQDDILLAPEVEQLDAQARAQASYAESVAAGQKPQLSWVLSGNLAGGASRTSDYTAGISLNMPLYQAGADAALSAARRRAEATRLQREESVQARRYRIAELHEAALSSFDRARRTVEILRNSERVRATTLQQWQQLGRRSLFDVMGAEGDYYSTRIAHVNALFDGQQAVAMMWSMGRGVMAPLR